MHNRFIHFSVVFLVNSSVLRYAFSHHDTLDIEQKNYQHYLQFWVSCSRFIPFMRCGGPQCNNISEPVCLFCKPFHDMRAKVFSFAHLCLTWVFLDHFGHFSTVGCRTFRTFQEIVFAIKKQVQLT